MPGVMVPQHRWRRKHPNRPFAAAAHFITPLATSIQAPPLPVSSVTLSPLLVSTEKMTCACRQRGTRFKPPSQDTLPYCQHSEDAWCDGSAAQVAQEASQSSLYRGSTLHHSLSHFHSAHTTPSQLGKLCTEKMTCACRKRGTPSNSAGHDPSCRGSALHHCLTHFHSARTTPSQLRQTLTTSCEHWKKIYQYTPLYCNAIGSLPLASRPLRTAHACSRAKAMALAAPLTPFACSPSVPIC